MQIRLFRAKRAEMGVGVLIVFIAMLLVAAIAAGVLITTVTSLQQKALTTGQEAKGEISTHLQFVQLSGENGIDGDMENVTAIAKLSSGSDPIDLRSVLVSFSLNNATSNLRYNSTMNYSNVNSTSRHFNVTYEVEGTEHREGFLVRGDVISMLMFPPRDMIEDEAVRLTFVPKVGTQTLLEFRTPSVIGRQTIFLFP
jgi:archaellin